MLACWVVGKRVSDFRIGPDRTTLPARAVYSETVRSQLAGSGVHPRPHELSATASASQWASGVDYLGKQALGLLLLRTKHTPSVRDVLTGQQRQLMDYWALTTYEALPLLFVDVLEAVPLVSPIFFTAKGCGVFQTPRHLFFELTTFSWE